MGGNPVSMVDPEGDKPFTAMLIGAAIGVISNGIGNLSQGNSFFDGAFKAAAFGAVGGAFSYGIGQAASQITNGFAKAAFQTAAHGHTSGVMSGIQGGSYGSGFASGGLSSSMSSVASAIGVGNVGMIGVGGLSGGVGSHWAGGDFWRGVGQGVITSGLNHSAHFILNQSRAKINLSKEFTIEEFFEAYINAARNSPHGTAQNLFDFVENVPFGQYNQRSGYAIRNKTIHMDGYEYRFDAVGNNLASGAELDFYNIHAAKWGPVNHYNGKPVYNFQNGYSIGFRLQSYRGINNNLVTITTNNKPAYNHLRSVYSSIKNRR